MEVSHIFSLPLTVPRRGQNDISFKIRTCSAHVWTTPLLREEINESIQAWRLSIPQTVCSRTAAAHRHLGRFRDRLSRWEERRKLKLLTRETLETSPQPLNIRCQIQETNIRHAHIYKLVIIHLIMKLRYVFYYLLCRIILWLTTYEGCVRRLYVIRGDLFKASVMQIWISEP